MANDNHLLTQSKILLFLQDILNHKINIFN